MLPQVSFCVQCLIVQWYVLQHVIDVNHHRKSSICQSLRFTPQDKGGTSERFRLVVPLGSRFGKALCLKETFRRYSHSRSSKANPTLTNYNKLPKNPGGWLLFHSQRVWRMAVLRMIPTKYPTSLLGFPTWRRLLGIPTWPSSIWNVVLRPYRGICLCQNGHCVMFTRADVVGFWSCWSFLPPCVIYKGRKSLCVILLSFTLELKNSAYDSW